MSDKTKVQPTCRYGHGALQQFNAGENTAWAIAAIGRNHMTAGMPVGSPVDVWMVMNRGYSVLLFRCPTCGYIELFDDEV